MERDRRLYPNAGGGESPRPALSRRTILAGSAAAAGVAATAGCLGEGSDGGDREVVERVEVGPEPYGATAARFRVERDSSGDAAYSIDTLTGEYEATYCIGECACGHEI